MKKTWLVTLSLMLGVYALLQAEPTKKPNAQTPPTKTPASAPQAGTLPTPLPAERFQGRVREAYKAASEIPEVFAGVACYCGCDKSQGHRNLLDCFVDDHGST